MSREWNGSLVMDEFAKIAAESGLIVSDLGKPVVGNTDKETPVKDHRRYEPGKEYNVTKETGEDLVGKAHPKDAKPAESMGDGALVENIVQQQDKDIEIATCMPTGALTGKHASLVEILVSLANDLEGEGKAEAAARVDLTIERLASFPFVDSLHKEAFLSLLAPVAKLLMWGGLGVGAWNWFGSKLTSVREGLATDIQDVLDTASSVGEKPELAGLANKLQSILGPYIAKFRQPMPLPDDKAGLAKYSTALDNFETDMTQASTIVEAMVAMPEEWYKLGLGAKSRLNEKFSDLKKTFEDTRLSINALSNVANKAMAKFQAKKPQAVKQELPGPDRITEIQELLSERGFGTLHSGKLDTATMNAIRRLEDKLDAVFSGNPETAEIIGRRGWDINGSILRPDGTVMEPDNLRRLLAVADRVAPKGWQ